MTRVAYAVRPWLATALAAAAVGSTAVAARTPMPERFLLGVVAVATTVEALRALLIRPTLSADVGGIEVVTGLTRLRLPWSEVVDVGALEPPERGGGLRRRADALEIDLGERLVVVPAYRLGTSAAAAASTLRELSTMTAASP